MIIYKIINLINNKIYIGQTKNIKKRWNEHKRCGKKDSIYNQLYADMNEYKIDNFTIEIIERINSPEIANEREKYWIKKLNSQDFDIGYNILKGGIRTQKEWKIIHDIKTMKKYDKFIILT